MNNEEKILQMLEQMQGDMTQMQGDMTKVHGKLSDLDTRVNKLNEQMALFENTTQTNFNFILEAMPSWGDRMVQVDNHEKHLDKHDHEIWALQKVVGK